MRHAVPFHRSTSAALAPDPAAKQVDRAGQAMPPNELAAAPVGFGVGCSSHLVPFHRCAMVSGVPEPCAYPSAVQAEEDWQATANRKSPFAPAGLGVG